MSCYFDIFVINFLDPRGLIFPANYYSVRGKQFPSGV